MHITSFTIKQADQIVGTTPVREQAVGAAKPVPSRQAPPFPSSPTWTPAKSGKLSSTLTEPTSGSGPSTRASAFSRLSARFIPTVGAAASGASRRPTTGPCSGMQPAVAAMYQASSKISKADGRLRPRVLSSTLTGALSGITV